HDRGVKVIFAEPQFSRRLADQVSRDLKVGVAELDTLETGALTPQFYEETMRRNLKTLQTHLR
ncbi:MAG TPA: zinc ABC transporter substrate-binding protein, partial [Verrucomicrobiae bacterium]|nr:zinc ABC transporter substrate-binding protein [Verrucomicrobiae bacterium]